MSSDNKMASSGRGGAGNIAPSSKTATAPVDLDTPTLKSPTYTTGRGGSGNMAKNDPTNPDEARRAQDIGAPMRRVSEGESHFGRGGAANTVKMTPEEIKKAQQENAIIEQEAKEKETTNTGGAVKTGTGAGPGEAPVEKAKGWAEKGLDFLKGKKDKN